MSADDNKSMQSYPACKELVRGQPYPKFSFGEVYHRIYGGKFSFTATRKGSSKNDL